MTLLLPAFVSAPSHGNIYHCRMEALLDALPSNSVDAIITDPPYPKEYLPLYGVLAEKAARVLKPGGSLVAMAGQSYLDEIMILMRPHLRYHWMLGYITPGASVQVWGRNVLCGWKPCLWYVKGDYDGKWAFDTVKSPMRDKRFHEWGQSVGGMLPLIERFTNAGDLIVDPFAGGGATFAAAKQINRRFIGCDVLLENVERSRARLNQPYTLSLFGETENAIA